MFFSALTGPTALVAWAAVFAVVGASHVRRHWQGREHVRFAVPCLAAAALTVACLGVQSPTLRLLPYALAPAVLAMSHVLSRRTRRDHEEMLALRAALEERSRDLAEADAAKTRFLATISHEVRTPLNGILGVNRMLLQALPAGRERELAEIVQAQGRSLLAIINDILDYSKIEAGRFVLEPADFSLRRVLNEAARAHREQAKGKGLRFVEEIDGAVPYRVHGDALRVRQVLDNLLVNAVKFTERGSVTLRARPEGPAIRFEVQDTGIGLDAATLAGLFQPFTQADSSTTRKYGGTGLGLAIVKSLVEMMGGTLGATGERGKGATFWMVLPLGPPQEPAGPLTPMEARTPIHGRLAIGSAGRALLAEDNAINRMVTVALLQEYGWSVEVATNGADAVAAFRRRAFDIVFLDCRMPELDGYGAARQMREHEAGGRRTPILALTAHALASEAERCRDAGMDDCLTKPIGAALMATVLQRWKPSAAPGGAAPALDPETLDDLARRSPALLRQLLEHYLGSIPGEITALRATAERGEKEPLKERAHELAGSALMVGARELARRLRVLENLDPTTSVLEALDRVEEEHRRVLATLTTRLGALAPP
jgi:signal transduction histidine kinase/CheY-like chemotaxis protein